MAKVSMINREKRRTKLVAKYAKKRAELKAIITNPDVVLKSSRTRCSSCRSCPVIQARCASVIAAPFPAAPAVSTGSLDLGRNKLREAAMRGDVPGLRKASW